MKINNLLALIAGLLMCATAFAQNPMVCGLHDHELLTERFLSNKKYVEEFGLQQKSGAITYVPIKYHIIGRTNGTGRQSSKLIMDMHCTLNNFFSDGENGIQFYIKDGFNYIDNDAAYEEHGSSAGQFQFRQNKDRNAVNIFIPKDANLGSGSLGTVLGYYTPSNDWIVLRKPEANGSSLTLPHELGHYLSLPHPFNGWDNEPYDATEHGVTVGANSPRGVPNEKMDGSNCNAAGDFMCDTPPSYLFFGAGCNYSGGARDPDGVLVDPDELNIMDYFDDGCGANHFTQEQKANMQADLESRSELSGTWNPVATTVSGPPTLIGPLAQSTTSGYDIVSFDWEPVEGADRYLLEISRLSDFSLNPIVEVVFDTSFEVTDDFEAGKQYYWRVTPFNPYYSCASSSNITRFTTGLALNNNNVLAVDHLAIKPNLVTQNYVIVSLETKDAFDSEISIVSATGQTLQLTEQYFPVGHSDIELSIENIPNGMYFVNIISGEKFITKKIIVAN